MRAVENLHDFAGMLVFDKGTCNTKGRQTVFFQGPLQEMGEPAGRSPEQSGQSMGVAAGAQSRYRTLMIDQGFCFNAVNSLEEVLPRMRSAVYASSCSSAS